jgi:protein-tyrosine phosphatase
MSEQVIPIEESYWVIPGKFRAGRYPASYDEIESRKQLRWLFTIGINIIIDLTEEGESGAIPYLDQLNDEAKKNHLEVAYHRMPIRDFSVPSNKIIIDILNEIDASIENGKHIYLHCQGGKGRTGILVGCFLARHGSTGDQAINKIKLLRRKIPGGQEPSPETETQKRKVLEWKQGQ